MTDHETAARKTFAEEGLLPHAWSNEAGFYYPQHSHPYHKVLYCIAGAITFHTGEGAVVLRPGDRLDLPPGTVHSATVGPEGVTCMEAAKD
ncbi:MAG: cupin domain-containing protein [Acidimicrobiia bacterium]